MKCLICQKRKAVKTDPIGWMPCLVCQKRQRTVSRPKVTTEITTDAIREDRKKFSGDILQPFRQGELSREYIEAYPDRAKKMVEEGHITKEEIKSSKYVWGDEDFYKKE